MDKHGETQFPGRLNGRDNPTLEACAWKDGNIELRVSFEKFPDRWVNLEVNLGDVIQWYRKIRRAAEDHDSRTLMSLVHPTDDLEGELGAR